MIIGVTGYGFSGSSAVYDLLKEYDDNIFIKTNRVCEFSIAYESDGLFDLEKNVLYYPMKHIKGDIATYRFINFCRFYSKMYNRMTNNKFDKITEEFINSIIQVKYKNRRISKHGNNLISRFLLKVLGKIQITIEEKIKKKVNLLKEDDCYICNYPDDFVEKARKYIEEILKASNLYVGEKNILLDQPFPPNQPEVVFHYFSSPKAIVVDRDPRDIYLTVKNMRYTSGRFIPHDNVDDFIKYYRAVRQGESNNSDVMRIHFEDLLYNYDETISKIEGFFKLENHNNKFLYFDPKKSINNTQLKYVFLKDAEDISKIEMELSEYLYDFDHYDFKPNHQGIYEMASW